MDDKIKHSEAFLREMTNSSSGFVTPTSYFSQVEDKILMNSLEDSFSKTEGFGVPDTYFETLEDRILNQVKDAEVRVIPFRKKVLKWIPAAAAAIIALFITFNFIDFNSNEITDDEIINWFENDLSMVTSDDFALALEESELSEITITTLSENTIEEYLNNQDITSLLEDY